MVQNFNQGLWVMVTLAAQDYFKVYLGLEPGVMALYMSSIMFMWSIKILYGLVSDNLPICGTRRKSYVFIMGILQLVSTASVFAFNIQKGIVVCVLIALAAMTIAFTNVVVDAILCV